MSVSAIVVSHGHAAELAQCLPALAPEVDELVVVANLPGSAAGVPPGHARDRRTPDPLPLAANVNAGVAATTGDLVLVANPDAIAGPAPSPCSPRSCRPILGAGSPGRRSSGPTGRGSPPAGGSRRCRGRLSGARRCASSSGPYETQRGHYLLDERPDEPVEADWMLGAFLLQRRAMLEQIGGWDAGYRHYIEDIDLCYRAMRAGWERWYVPAAVVTHAYAAVIDRRFLSRHTLWHARGMARFVRRHPETVIGATGRARRRS